jgi:hypothetical protein
MAPPAPIVTSASWDEFPAACRIALMPGLQRYFDQRVRPGDFLCAVLKNDLAEACGRADRINAPLLPAIVAWLNMHAPATSWGSAAVVEAWLHKGESGR